ncbi:5' nucleotidase, NT5C type [Butyrivibrio sp. NC2002]|uniref:5' nucleotidase, NT5C type n=1 Tax=Butyrivibrio sp. NC2002 TaxID=1410610 RepID=UPI00055E8545|nr:2-dehydropantoate 2-reductase [Butyrivibrio sp. NC2002]
MKIYVDFDDCLCETAKAFTKIAARFFQKDVPYEEMHSFNLQESFGLTDDEYQKLMAEGHTDEVLLSYDETPGASRVLNEFIDEGHEVFVITGRPAVAYGASRKWLDEHGLDRAQLYCLNKYGRDFFLKDSEFSLELEDYYKMKFDYAIEDSPLAFKYFDHMPDLKVMVFDRPWNKNAEFPNGNYTRTPDWDKIRQLIRKE